MPASKFLKQVAGVFTEEAPAVAGGAPNANKIPALDGNGRLTADMMPTGIVADNATLTAVGALAAGDFVNIYDGGGGTFRCRKCDGTTAGKQAHGYVLAAVANGAPALIYFEGLNDQVSGQVPGDVFMQTTAGLAGATAPSGSGNVVQRLGVAVSATAINVELGPPITLA